MRKTAIILSILAMVTAMALEIIHIEYVNNPVVILLWFALAAESLSKSSIRIKK